MERFAFVFHPLRLSDFARKFPFVRRLPPRLVEEAFGRIPPFAVSRIRGVRSHTGRQAEGWFIALPLTPRLLLERPFERWVLPRIVAAVEKGAALGAGIVGLGAFTKVVGDRGVSVARSVGVPVTTGNSYTAASAVEGALKAAQALDQRPRHATAAVIGATGAIGKAVSWLLASEVGALTLVARQPDKLELLQDQLRRLRGAEVTYTTDVREAARRADILLTVSSSPDVLVEPQDIRSGAVVCDVSRPRNVSARVYEERDDVLVIDGGVIQVPGEVDFGFDFGFPPGTAEACIAETMILALEQRYESYTLGSEISVEQVQEIARLAKKHGFQVAGFRRFERAIPEQEVEEIRKRARRVS